MVLITEFHDILHNRNFAVQENFCEFRKHGKAHNIFQDDNILKVTTARTIDVSGINERFNIGIYYMVLKTTFSAFSLAQIPIPILSLLLLGNFTLKPF